MLALVGWATFISALNLFCFHSLTVETKDQLHTWYFQVDADGGAKEWESSTPDANILLDCFTQIPQFVWNVL